MNSRREINPKSYADIISNDMYMFRRACRNSDSFYYMDTPGAYYFKLFFHFDDNVENANGLLGIPNIDFSRDIDKDSAPIKQDMTAGDLRNKEKNNGITGLASTAWNYLVNNNELKRANMLKDFIQLLSDINTYSPWYFMSVSGLDAVLDRTMFGDDFKIAEEKPKISIKCLADSMDSRIGTLLDLYRAICYDYEYKREILPDNLRRFDMSIYIFHSPLADVHKVKNEWATPTGEPNNIGGHRAYIESKKVDAQPTVTSDTVLGVPDNGSDRYFASSKMIELHNCEIDINSSKSAYAELSNEEAFAQEYTIDISVSDAYEYRYNDEMGYAFGDYIMSTIMAGANAYTDDGSLSRKDSTQGQRIDNYVAEYSQDKVNQLTTANKSRAGKLPAQLELIEESVQQVGSRFMSDVTGVVRKPMKNTKKKLERLILGNLNSSPLNDVNNMLKSPLKTIKSTTKHIIDKSVDLYHKNNPTPESASAERKPALEMTGKPIGNIFTDGATGSSSTPNTGAVKKAQKMQKLNEGKNLVNSL